MSTFRFRRRRAGAGVREHKAAARRRALGRTVSRRKLRIVVLLFLTAIGGGLALDGTPYVTSSADGAPEMFAELSRTEFVTIPRRSEEALRARWEKLAVVQRRIHRNIATELRVKPAIPPLVAGTTAAEIAPKARRPVVPASTQLELREAANPELEQTRMRTEERRAKARSAVF